MFRSYGHWLAARNEVSSSFVSAERSFNIFTLLFKRMY